jgi:hypothetical protein
MRRGHPLGSVAATIALSDWERRTAVGDGGEDWDDEADEHVTDPKEKP